MLLMIAVVADSSAAELSGGDSFYVWQQLWSSNVLSAVNEEPSTTLYPLACVVPPKGESYLFNIPWCAMPEDWHKYIPVIRIPLKAFRRYDLADELEQITQKLITTMLPHKLEEIQLDLDCPERLLDKYLELIQIYRQKHPSLGLSITALPSHLKNRTFRDIAKSVDFYVLQVHGIEIPKNMSERVELLNMKTAVKALKHAELIRAPYCVALPCYAYELNFDPDSGDFMFLNAEKAPKRLNTKKLRSVSDNRNLIELNDIVKTLVYSKGVIWFRLPIAGNRLCLPREALALIQSGVMPKPTVECRIQTISDSTIELELYNENTINSPQALLKIKWVNPRGSWDVYHGMYLPEHTSGQLPSEIIVPVPPPGESRKIGWFQAASNNFPEIGVTLK